MLSLLNDGELSEETRDFIKDTKGYRTPPGYEVSHETPLYSAQSIEEMKRLDAPWNMKLIPTATHRKQHRVCGNTYHEYGPANKPYRKKMGEAGMTFDDNSDI